LSRATLADVKTYVHTRLREEDRKLLELLKRATGSTESEILRRGLRLVAAEENRQPSALEIAGRSVGRFRKGPSDLSTNHRHLEGFGK
jgi:hypothetical protein